MFESKEKATNLTTDIDEKAKKESAQTQKLSEQRTEIDERKLQVNKLQLEITSATNLHADLRLENKKMISRK